MKLFYFDLPARAEPSRIMMKAAGVDFDDVVFTGEEWGAQYKAMSPSGQCPFLELDDGTIIFQTAAVNRYVARVSGFMPTDNVQAAMVDQVLACLDDLFHSFEPTFHIKDPEEQVAARVAAMSEGGATAAKCAVIENILADRKTEYISGDEPMVADIVLFCSICLWTSGFFPGFSMDIFKRFPVMAALRTKVANHPKIKPIYADATEGLRLAFKP